MFGDRSSPHGTVISVMAEITGGVTSTAIARETTVGLYYYDDKFL